MHCKPNRFDVYLDTSSPKYCKELEPLTLDYEVMFNFEASSDISPPSFQSPGFASVYHGKVDSVTSVLLGSNVISRPPTAEDLDGSMIKIPIAGVQGSTNSKFDPLSPEECASPLLLQDGNVEVYFFAEEGEYIAILEAQLQTSGNMMTCRLKEIRNNLPNDDPVPILFTSVLRYIKLPVKHMPTGPMALPT